MKYLIVLLSLSLLACCGGSGNVTGATALDAPTPNEQLAMDLAQCYASYHGVDVRVIWYDENRGDGACAWAWNLDADLHDIAWIVAHEVCHKKGFPDDYNEENSTLRFCINTTLSQSGCNY
jgi:hypothetical protein